MFFICNKSTEFKIYRSFSFIYCFKPNNNIISFAIFVNRLFLMDTTHCYISSITFKFLNSNYR